jgi:transcriptional regulator of acetoin/glycerol metabolism
MSPSLSIASVLARAPLPGGASAAAAPIPPVPGALLVFACGQPMCQPLPLRHGEMAVGRSTISQLTHDTRLSRRHTTITRKDGRWSVEDLSSHNGTFVDGRPISGSEPTAAGAVVRAGSSVFLLYDDVAPFATRPVAWRSGVVLGPEMQECWDAIAAAAVARDSLHLAGEPGSGRELAARHYHDRSGRKGPFIAVNCAAVPPTLAAELFFDKRDGYVSQVGTGTLFLDAVTELDPAIQQRLARELDARDLAVCSATHASLAGRVKSGAFHADLAQRLSARVVTLPALRERRADLPWIIAGVTKARGNVTPHVTLIEAALLRRWPGNVRELRVDLAAATNAALDAGAIAVRASDLGTEARRRR